jgi:nitrate/TMAO reductase-like tetraheme cytochrome c subunit
MENPSAEFFWRGTEVDSRDPDTAAKSAVEFALPDQLAPDRSAIGFAPLSGGPAIQPANPVAGVESPSLADLPDVCLGGLPGIDPAGKTEAERGSESDRIRHIVGAFSGRKPELAPRALETASSAQEIPARSIRTLPAMDDGEESGKRPVQAVGFETLYNPHARATAANLSSQQMENIGPGSEFDCVDPHADVFQETMFPSATRCANCHEQIYEEWAGSSHAYAAVSPMFQRFEDTINQLSQGTIGYFCLRCHAPVATTSGLRRDQAIWDGPRVFREGVTCIACHRVKENYTKANGERRIEPGDLFAPVYSGKGEIGSQIVAKYKDFFKVKTSADDKGPGQPIHTRAIQFEQLSQSDFCMSCHQVAVQPGIKLEVVWDQYRASPAYRDGTTCQECHMGIVPGRAEGYSIGPAAVVDGKVVNPERKHSNHLFFGPGYSIANPGVFPQNVKADRWSFNDWLMFDWRSGWGTDDFENGVAEGRVSPYFPPVWAEADDRYDAREIVDANLRKLAYKQDIRRQVLENGSRLDGPFFQQPPLAGQALRFHYCVTNSNPGHNMPSGSLGAQPQLWLNVVLIDPDGNRVWESGYLDTIGDLADTRSDDVLQRRVPLDKQLFNLQTRFLTTNVKGTDREMNLPINLDIDQLPFIRPAPQPVTVLNHPPGIRMEAHSIPPLGSRKAKYVIPAGLIQQPGTWRLSVRMRSRAEPVYFMNFVKSTPEMIRMMNEWIVDAHVQSVVFEVQ